VHDYDNSEPSELADHATDELLGDLAGARSEEHERDRPAGCGVDGSELPHRPDAFEFPDEEAVQRDQVPGTRGEVTEPERSLQGGLGDESAAGRGELRRRLIRHCRWPSILAHQRIETVGLARCLPAVIRRAADTEHPARVRHARLDRMLHDTHAPLIDDLCRGHGDGLLRLCERNQRVHRRGLPAADLQPQLVNRKH
jgi:hypothetical protein